MRSEFTIAVDAMGGDFGPRITVRATLDALRRHAELSVLLFGDQDQIKPFLVKLPDELSVRLTLIHTDSVVGMDEKPSHAVRYGRQSSMALALEAVARGDAQACVSAGNTGALTGLGRLRLKTLPGISRPAIVAAIPTMAGHSFMLDLGANVDCSAEDLRQFAVMGSVMLGALEPRSAVRIGLLNIGQEEIKGNEQVKQAARLIEQDERLNYIGFVEGGDIFAGDVDLIVCDGFTGNVALKSCEGLARMIAHQVRTSFTRNLIRRLLSLCALPILNDLKRKLDPSRRNGASLLGLQGVVIKSHGSADHKCFGYALDRALKEARNNVPERISKQLSSYLVQE